MTSHAALGFDLALSICQVGLALVNPGQVSLFLILDHEHGGHGELDGFSKSDHVGEDETGSVGGEVGFEGFVDEVFLVSPEAVLTAVDGSFDQGARGIFVLFPFRDRTVNLSFGNALDVLENGVSECKGFGMVLEFVEFFTDPGNGFGGVVFPDELVVYFPGIA